VQPWMVRAKGGKKTPEKPELRIDQVGSVKLKEVKGLSGAFTLLMAGADRQDQLVFHRPIGHTDLDVGEWVCSAAADIPTLLAGAEDPREAHISRLETQTFLDLVVGEGLLRTDEEGWHYYPDGGCRETILTEADEEVKRRLAELKAQHDAKQQGKEKAAQWHGQHSVTRNDVLTDKYREFEEALRARRKELRQEIRERVPRTYRTLGGPLRDRPQKACPVIPKGANMAEAYAAVNKTVSYSLLQGDTAVAELQALQQGNAVMSAKIRDMQREIAALKQERDVLQTSLDDYKSRVAAFERGQKTTVEGGSEAKKPPIPSRPEGGKIPPPGKPPAPPPKGVNGRGPPPDVDTPAVAAPDPPKEEGKEDDGDPSDEEDPVVGDDDITSALSSLDPAEAVVVKEKIKASGGKTTRRAFGHLLDAFSSSSRRQSGT
jgi:hypothetical protein